MTNATPAPIGSGPHWLTCGDCVFATKYGKYGKCLNHWRGATRGSSTDISFKWPACSEYQSQDSFIAMIWFDAYCEALGERPRPKDGECYFEPDEYLSILIAADWHEERGNAWAADVLRKWHAQIIEAERIQEEWNRIGEERMQRMFKQMGGTTTGSGVDYQDIPF